MGHTRDYDQRQEADRMVRNRREELDDTLKSCFDDGVEYERERIINGLEGILSEEQMAEVRDELDI